MVTMVLVAMMRMVVVVVIIFLFTMTLMAMRRRRFDFLTGVVPTQHYYVMQEQIIIKVDLTTIVFLMFLLRR